MPEDTVADTAMGPPRPTTTWHVLTGIWAFFAAVMSGRLAPGLLLGMTVVLSGGLLGLIWCVQFARVLLNREARRRLTGRALASWAVCPATGLFLAALTLSQWPVALRVKLSEPALLRLAQEVEDGRDEVTSGRLVGLMVVDGTVLEESCVLLHTDSGFFFVKYGLAYSRDGDWPSSHYYGTTSFRRLFGRWYTFCARE